MRTLIAICLVFGLLVLPKEMLAQEVTVAGTYSNLNGGQLPEFAAENMTITVFDDNGSPINSTLVRDIQSRQGQGGQQLNPDKYTLVFESPTIPNKTVSIRFDAPTREIVTIPRVLSTGDQNLNVVLPEGKQSRCDKCDCSPRQVRCRKFRRRFFR